MSGGPKLGSSTKTVPWVEKYRPTSLEDIVSHADILSTVKQLVERNKLPHLLFYGPPGTGKTTTALAIARMLYKRSFAHQVLELNASDERGIDVVRKQIKDFASTRTVYNAVSFKMVILDEADMMTSEAQAALRRVIEQFTKNVRFVLICNHVSKLLPAIQSRCTRFRFLPIKTKQMVARLKEVLEAEGVTYTPTAVIAANRLSGGDMRRAINLLQAATMSACGAKAFAVMPEDGDTVMADATTADGPTLTEEVMYTSTGNPTPSDVAAMMRAMTSLPLGGAYEAIREMQIAKGLAASDLIKEIGKDVLRVSFPADCMIYLLDKLSDLEQNCVFGCVCLSVCLLVCLSACLSVCRLPRRSTSDEVHVAALCGTFAVVREAVTSKRSILAVTSSLQQ